MSESTVLVKANQTTTDWQDGAIFSVERTEYVDKLLENGVLSIYIPDGDPLFVGKDVVLGERYDLDATPLTDEDAKAAGFDFENPDALPPADEHAQTTDPDAELAAAQEASESANDELQAARDDAETALADVNADLDEEKPAETKPRTKRASAKKSDDASE